MDLGPFEGALNELEEALSLLDEKREELLKAGREVIRLSSKSILLSISGKDGEEPLKRARELLSRVKEGCPPKLAHLLTQAESELVEAEVVLSVVKEGRIPSFLELGADPDAYLLGILDALGELRRMFYDLLGKGDERAFEVFEAMDRLYSHLLPLSGYGHVAQGARRKLDSVRYAVEGARAAVAEELRRKAMIEELKGLRNE